MSRVLFAVLMVALLVLAGTVAAGEGDELQVNTTMPAAVGGAATPAAVVPVLSGPPLSDVRPHDMPAMNIESTDGGPVSAGPIVAPPAGPALPGAAGTAEGLNLPEISKPGREGFDGAGHGRALSSVILPVKKIKSGTRPALVSRFDTKIDMFYYNDTGYLYTAAATTGNSPEWPWEYEIGMGGFNYTLFSPGACSAGINNLAVFITWYNGGIYETEWNGVSWETWSADLTGLYDANSTPACVSRGDGNIELVYRNKTGVLVHKSRNGGVWTDGVEVYPRILNSEGVSLISTSASGFDIIMHYPNQSVPDYPSYYDGVCILHWDNSSGWGAVWNAPGIPAYSYVGATTRDADAAGTGKYIDIVYDKTGSQDYYWNVSRDGGVTWSPDPGSHFGFGDGRIDSGGSPYNPIAPRYERLEFYQEYSGVIFENAYLIPSKENIGVSRGSKTWLLDKSGNGAYGAGDLTYTFGKAGDLNITGDWNGDGKTEIGVVRNNRTWLLDKSGDGAYGAGDLTYTFGRAGDVYVTGDWNADMKTEIGVFRDNRTWLLDWSADGTFGGGDLTYTFGKAGDVPVTGDWNGNGATEIGVFRDNRTWLLDKSGNGAFGAGDLTYTFGKAGDVPVTGDWDGDGTTEIGVVRNNNTWLLDASGNGAFGAGDLTYTFGKAGDKPVTGVW
jgi:hypothetical protein